MGWPDEGTLDKILPGKSIGGDKILVIMKINYLKFRDEFIENVISIIMAVKGMQKESFIQ